MVPIEETSLSAELQYYASHKAEWLGSHSGEYVVIKGRTRLGFYQTFEAAYRAGAARFGVDTDFLVRKVVEQEPVFVLY